MNLIQKAKLIQEVQQLIQMLQQPSLILFDRAKAHQRLKDIFHSCDEPAFQKQLIAFREHLSPDLALQERLLSSCYQLSFCGQFHCVEELQQQLKPSAESHWGLSYSKAEGWNVGLFSPQLTEPCFHHALSLADCFAWLAQCQQKGLLKSDEYLQPTLPVLTFEEIALPAVPDTHIDISPKISTALTASPPSLVESGTAQKRLTVQPLLVKPKTIPKTLEIEALHCQLQLSQTANPQEPLYQLTPEPSTCIGSLRLYSCAYDTEQLIQNPVYLGEQVNRQGRFVTYVALLGAKNQVQALRLLNQLSNHQRYILAACKATEWPLFNNALNDIARLFELYSSESQLVWKREQYRAHIPVELLYTQKFISFEETPATADTPLILLREREKIRVVHGESRLQLASDTSFLPYLMLDRQAGISWQLIRQTLQNLPTPVQAGQLFQALMYCHIPTTDQRNCLDFVVNS